MLSIDRPARTIPKREYFDNRTQEFITVEETRLEAVHLQLEHSLRSIAKWESRWHVAFSGRENMSGEELLDYIRCMTVNQVKNPKVYEQLTQEDLLKIVTYMQDPNSAWEISSKKKAKKARKRQDTVETVYYAMIQFGIPMECENWHFNRLMALLDYFDAKGGGNGGGNAQKRNKREMLDAVMALNMANRKKYNSKG